MRGKRNRGKSKKRVEKTRTLDFFNPKPEPEKPKPKRLKRPRAVHGTVQWYRDLYYLNDLRTLLRIFRHQFPNLNNHKFRDGINYILFGKNKDGKTRTEPVTPNPSLMTTNTALYRFQEKVYNAYWK